MMNNKCWYEIKAVSNDDDTTEVFIYDEIGEWGVTAKNFIDALNTIKTKYIDLRINTPGGSVWAGNAIYNALKRHDSHITSYIDGLAASMGSIIALSGDKVYMADNAMYMIHNPWTLAHGDAHELRQNALLLDKLKSAMKRIYSDKTGIDDKMLSRLMDEETWYTAEEAKAEGFVDDIQEGLKVAAIFDQSKFKAFKKTPDLLYNTITTEQANAITTEQSLNPIIDNDDYTEQLIRLKKSQLLMSILDRKTTKAC